MRYHCKFLISAGDVRQFPPPLTPEIAFLGRSNVGKSSVINSLVGEKAAKTSATPGRTRTINFFALRRQGAPRPELVFADLPGYGYAKLPRQMTAEWPGFIDPYLQKRKALALCVCLVDVSIQPQERDRQLIEFLRHIERQILIVCTKADRLSGSQLHTALQAFGRAFQTGRLLPFSAKTGAGRDELWKEILKAAGEFAL